MESAKNSQLQTLKANRVANLQKMLQDQKRQLLRKVHRHCQSLLASKKYKHYRSTLQERITMSHNFIKNSADSFFTMLADKEYLLITTEIDVIQKVEKFKKNILNSLQKIPQNLQSSIAIKPATEHKISKKQKQNQNQSSEQQYSAQKPKRRSARYKNKSKNFKISNDATKSMMQWLLKNFQNPYPTTQQKQQMSKQGGISMMKVNNWFINARERTVKSYFQKDN